MIAGNFLSVVHSNQTMPIIEICSMLFLPCNGLFQIEIPSDNDDDGEERQMLECEAGVVPITREKGAADVTAWWSRDHRHPLDRHIFGSDDNHRHCHSCTDVDDRDVVLMKRSFFALFILHKELL